MRKFFFILFGVVFVALILLVDWREKLTSVSQQGAAKTLTQAWPFKQHPDTTAMQPIMQDPAPGDRPLAATPADSSPGYFPEQHEMHTDPDPSGQSTPAIGDNFPPDPRRFQDIPEQPYLEKSRELLQQTVQNYRRIGAASTADRKNQ